VHEEYFMDFDVKVKLAIYDHFVEAGESPAPEEIAARVGSDVNQVLEAYGRLQEQRVLVLEADGASIRMAPPFSGVPTQHVVESGGNRYHANCAWDALGVAAALGKSARVFSHCEGSGDPLQIEIGPDGPEPSDWIFHSLVPAAQWWEDIVFT
jgi:hypothetical protein